MARPDLSNEEIEAMAREEPGSAARYLEERRTEIEAEKQAARDKDDKERFIRQFLDAGGTSKSEGEAAWKAHKNEQAVRAAHEATRAAEVASRRRALGGF